MVDETTLPFEARTRPVPRVDAAALGSGPELPAFLAQVERDGRPVLLENAVAHWPALERWSPSYLRERLAGQRIRYLAVRDAGYRYQDAEFGEFVERIEDDANRLSTPLTELPKPLRSDFASPVPDEASALIKARFWMTRRESTTPLHWDIAHNLFAQVKGTKAFLLAHPRYYLRLCPRGRFDLRQPNFSTIKANPLVDADHGHESLERVPFLLCRVKRGDLLFIPNFWWHLVHTLEDSYSVNFWYTRRRIHRFLSGLADAIKPKLDWGSGEWH